MPATYDLESIESGERWLPIVPRVGLDPHTGLEPNLGGGATAEISLSLGSILSGEAWGAGARMLTGWFDIGSIASGESWFSSYGLTPHTGLYPHVGRYPHGSGVSWAWLFSLPSIQSGETWGGTDWTVFAARVFSKLALPSAVRKRVRFSA